MSQAPSITLLDNEQAAKLLGLSTSTLNKWRVYGEGPRFAKIGRRIAYRLTDLEAWIASRLRGSTSE